MVDGEIVGAEQAFWIFLADISQKPFTLYLDHMTPLLPPADAFPRAILSDEVLHDSMENLSLSLKTLYEEVDYWETITSLDQSLVWHLAFYDVRRGEDRPVAEFLVDGFDVKCNARQLFPLWSPPKKKKPRAAPILVPIADVGGDGASEPPGGGEAESEPPDDGASAPGCPSAHGDSEEESDDHKSESLGEEEESDDGDSSGLSVSSSSNSSSSEVSSSAGGGADAWIVVPPAPSAVVELPPMVPPEVVEAGRKRASAKSREPVPEEHKVFFKGGEIWYYEKSTRFVAKCYCHDGEDCEKSRVARVGKKAGQGKPLGYLAAWLAYAHNTACEKDRHQEVGKPGNIGFDARENAREQLYKVPGAATLFGFEKPNDQPLVEPDNFL